MIRTFQIARYRFHLSNLGDGLKGCAEAAARAFAAAKGRRES